MALVCGYSNGNAALHRAKIALCLVAMMVSMQDPVNLAHAEAWKVIENFARSEVDQQSVAVKKNAADVIHVRFIERPTVAEDVGDAAERAQLAGDLPRLSELRSMLRQRMLESPLTDAKGFAREIEEAYRRMWVDWCGKPASALQFGTAIR